MSSVSDIMYGRQGGRFVPPAAPAADAPAKRRDPEGPCSACPLPRNGHGDYRCPVCREPKEHHPDGDADCWEGRARMAAARHALERVG